LQHFNHRFISECSNEKVLEELSVTADFLTSSITSRQNVLNQSLLSEGTLKTASCSVHL